MAQVSDAADRAELEQAMALDGLHFALLGPAQAHRIAVAVIASSRQLRSELQHSEVLADREHVEVLTEMEPRLLEIQAPP